MLRAVDDGAVEEGGGGEEGEAEYYDDDEEYYVGQEEEGGDAPPPPPPPQQQEEEEQVYDDHEPVRSHTPAHCCAMVLAHVNSPPSLARTMLAKCLCFGASKRASLAPLGKSLRSSLQRRQRRLRQLEGPQRQRYDSLSPQPFRHTLRQRLTQGSMVCGVCVCDG